MNKEKAVNYLSSAVHDFKKHFNLLKMLVIRNIKTTYRESVLGIIWTVLNPLLTMLVLSFVYGQLFGRNMPNMKYEVYVLSGMIIFNTFFRTGTTNGLNSIVGHRALVMQTRVSISIYPRVQVYTAFVNFAFSFIALIIVMLICQQPFKVTLLMTLILMPALTLFTMGISFFMSVVYVYFRDIKNIYGVVLSLWMYATPIFYTIDALKNPVFEQVLQFNPMYYYVNYFRQIIMGNVPSLKMHIFVYGMGIFVYLLGYLIIRHSRKRLIFHL